MTAPGGQVPARPWPWPAAGGLHTTRAALLCIDFQHDFCSPGGFADAQGFDLAAVAGARAQARRVQAAARAAGWLVVHTRVGSPADVAVVPRRVGAGRGAGPVPGDRGPRGRYLTRGEPGHDIVPDLAPLPGEPVVDKPGKGAFYATELDPVLRSAGVTRLVFTGVTSDVCVQSTYREAADRGYECLWLSDAIGSYWPEAHDAAVLLAAAQGGLFGTVATTDDLLHALARA
ncbi:MULTISPECIES: cysteine hydrolase family protein [unclassified Blastococcus]